MKRARRLGLRTRLALALAGVAAASVLVATLLANIGVHRRVDQFERDRLRGTAIHSAQLGAELYRQQGHWTAATATELGHVAAMDGFRLVLFDATGQRIAGTPVERGQAQASARVTVGGHAVGSVTVAPTAAAVISKEHRDLDRSLTRLHLAAGALAIALGLAAAALLVPPLLRPLRRIVGVARRMEQGDLHARVQPAGVPELEALGQALNRLAETLEQQEQLRRTAAADIAHELRTPLAGIVSRIEAAQDGVLEDEQRNLEAMHTEALRLSQLVEDLGKLAEAERPGLTLDMQPVQLDEVVSELTVVYREYLDAKEIELEEQIEPARIYGDRRRIAQVVDNLLSNALRYTDPGGRVNVRVVGRDREAVIEVADTGAGIRGDDLPYIFDRFWRGEQSRARRTGGAGIGLAIVRELVRAHDGRIDVQSTPGHGTRFTVTLPAEKFASPQAVPTPESRPS